MRNVLILTLMVFVSLPVLADDVLDFQQWQDLNAMAQRNKQPDFLPPTLQPVTSKEGVYQQVFNYNIQQMKVVVPVAGKIADTNIKSEWGGDAASNTQTTFQMRPIDTKGSINIQNSVTASVNYQVWSRSTEAQITPNAKFMGMKLSISHLATPNDTQNRLLVKMEW